LKIKINEKKPLTSKDIVFHYFQCIHNKDIDGILELFDSDAVIFEPFSKTGSLRGKYDIGPFLKVAMMANTGFSREIKIDKMDNEVGCNDNRISALVTFERGSKVTGRFTFEFTNDSDTKKIKSLHIEFV
jgi:hypothetical protein